MVIYGGNKQRKHTEQTFRDKQKYRVDIRFSWLLCQRNNDKDSDIDIVVDTKELDIPTIEKLKNAFIPMKADVLITDLLKQEDTALDDLLISIGVGKIWIVFIRAL